MVETDAARLQAPAEEPLIAPLAEKTAEDSGQLTEQICQHVEEPAVYCETPAEEKQAETEGEETAEEAELLPEEMQFETSDAEENEKEEEKA